MKRMIFVAAVVLFGCKGKDKEAPAAGTTPATGSAPATAPPTGGAGGSATGTGGAAGKADARCDTECRFLADVALDQVADAFQQACGKPWTATDPKSCDQLDYQRNCIYATAGYTFKKPQWRDAFGKQPWYTARADFKETDLSRVASNNIRDLKQQALACRADGAAPAAIPSKLTASKISKADEAIIVGWFKQKAKGELVLPAKLEADGSAATKEDLEGWLKQTHLFQLKAWTPLEYASGKAGEPRSITAPTGLPGPDCKGEGEDCEGYEWITFDLDAKGAIVGISVNAAACPLVYVEERSGALSYQGEILRNLVKPAWEATQHLALDATCGGEVRVQLVEAKDEITYLDDVALVVDGVAVAPRACGDAAAPAYCGDDGRYTTLVRGQTLALVFDVDGVCAAPQLRADGYYVPLGH